MNISLCKPASAGICVLLWLGAVAATVHGQTAYLVTDLGPGEIAAATNPDALLPAGRHLFFGGVEGTYSEPQTAQGGLWVTDGTPAGTRRLPVGCQSCSPRFVASIGDVAFYTLADPVTPRLWRSDGTLAGTVQLTDRFDPEEPFAVQGSTLYFVSYVYDNAVNDYSEQLWRTDGTAAGTGLVADLGPGLYFDRHDLLVAAGGKVFLTGPAAAPNNSLAALWVSDGTAQGTTRISAASNTYVGLLAPAGGKVFFSAAQPGAATAQLWVSDGTAAGTRMVVPAARLGWLKPSGNRVYYDGNDTAQRLQLWVSDATAAGTRQVTAAANGLAPVGGAFQLAEAGGRLVFVSGGRLWAAALDTAAAPVALCRGGSCDWLDQNTRLDALGSRVAFLEGNLGTGFGLWATDGTPGGTALLKQLCTDFCQSQPFATLAGGAVFFWVLDANFDYELWTSDGTAAGTRRFASQPIPDNPGPPVVAQLGTKLFFAAIDDSSADPGTELYVTDGTSAGARQLTDATNPLGSSPANLGALGNQVVFTAATPGPVFLHSAGTASSTVPVSGPQPSGPLVAAGGAVFFAARDPVSSTSQLWKLDGSFTATPLTAFAAAASVDGSVPPVAAGGRLYFAVAEYGAGESVWSSDGTPQGTVRVFQVPAPKPELLQATTLAATGGAVFLVTVDRQSFVQTLWTSGGTAGGAVKLGDIGGSGFVELGGTVYFVGPGPELWQTDGTPEGTRSVQLGGASLENASDLVIAGGALYLFAGANDQSGRLGLWRTDGTAAGTILLQRFQPSASNGTDPSGLTPFSNGLAFLADDGIHGYEPWITDGTAAGTRLLADVRPGSLGSKPGGLVAAGGRLFFAADDGVHGSELWESDGTTAGTRQVQDINPGPASANPAGMTAAGGLLYFSANDGLTGPQLWALPLSGPGGCPAGATALCLAGGRFEVTAFWRDFQGRSGAGQARALTGDTGAFWFFDPSNVEVIVKVLDGRALDGHFWVFYGALSNVEYSLTVTDTATGIARRYFNPLGELASVGDTTAFGPLGASAIGGPGTAPAVQFPRASAIPATPARLSPSEPGAARQSNTCLTGALQLCLNGARFAVEASFKDFNGHTGTGQAVALSDETGYFWFFSAGNIETVLKVIDGRGLNGHFWVFYGALSDVQYTLTVTDTVTGAVKTYTNPAGQFASVADTTAF